MSLGRIGWSIGHERAAACSAVKATRSAGDPNLFGSALTASARCRNWSAVIDGPMGRLRLPRPWRPPPHRSAVRRLAPILQSASANAQFCRFASGCPSATFAEGATIEVSAWGGAGKRPRSKVSIMATECGSERRRSRPTERSEGAAKRLPLMSFVKRRDTPPRLSGQCRSGRCRCDDRATVGAKP